MNDEPHFRLTLRALRGSVPAYVRLRRALKALLRAYNLRCTKVEELPACPPNSPSAASETDSEAKDPSKALERRHELI